MRITNIHPENDAGYGGNKTLARFSVDLGALTLHSLTLKRKPDGSHRVNVPNLRGTNTVTISPTLAKRIAELALIEWRACARDVARN